MTPVTLACPDCGPCWEDAIRADERISNGGDA